MPTKKQLVSLRLEPEVLERVDRLIAELAERGGLPPEAVSRNAVLERWVEERLAEEERRLEGGSSPKS